MRTTLTLDPDVVQILRTRMASRKSTLKQVINDALRRGLSMEPPKSPKPFRVTGHSLGMHPGIDVYKLNQLADELETQDMAARVARRKRR